MKKTGIKALTIISGLFFGNSVNAQNTAGISTQTFHVAGNCGMCKKTIETSAKIKGVKSADWNESNKILTVKYEKRKTGPEQLLRNVAYAGYDNEKFLAPDAAYNKLHACCQYEREKKAPKAMAPHDHHETALQKEPKSRTAQVRESGIQNVYAQYFSIKEALVKSDPALASAAAIEFIAAVEKIDMTAFKEKEHDAFMKSVNQLKDHSKSIEENKALDKQRSAFGELSDNIFDLMKEIKPGYEIYYDHCPMYNNGKGANWISKEMPIRNPYYGSKMMPCGNILETLK